MFYQVKDLTKGPIHPKELLRVTDVETVQKYLLEEVQKYTAQLE